MANTYDTGDLVRVTGTFTTAAGVALDPTALYLKYKNPAGTVTTLTYGVDAAVVKDSTGVYHVDISATTAGVWMYRWYSTGTGQAAEEHWFTVNASQVA